MCVVVGFAGPPCAGLSTLVQQIQEMLMSHDLIVTVISWTSYRQHGEFNTPYHPDATDWPQIAQAIAQLKSTGMPRPTPGPAQLKSADGTVVAPHGRRPDVILVEGCGLFLDEEVLEQLDLPIWLLTPLDTCLTRFIGTPSGDPKTWNETIRPTFIEHIAATKGRARLHLPLSNSTVGIDVIVGWILHELQPHPTP